LFHRKEAYLIIQDILFEGLSFSFQSPVPAEILRRRPVRTGSQNFQSILTIDLQLFSILTLNVRDGLLFPPADILTNFEGLDNKLH